MIDVKNNDHLLDVVGPVSNSRQINIKLTISVLLILVFPISITGCLGGGDNGDGEVGVSANSLKPIAQRIMEDRSGEFQLVVR